MAATFRASYEWYAHEGVTRPPSTTRRVSALHDSTAAVLDDEREDNARPIAALVEQGDNVDARQDKDLCERLGVASLIELVVLIACYRLFADVLHVFAVDVLDGPDPVQDEGDQP